MSTRTSALFLSHVMIFASISTNTIGQDASLTKSVEKAIIQQTNDFRESNQLRVVNSDEHLTQAAKEFAEFMARTGKYGHRADGKTPAERAEKAGYEYCVVRENIAYRSNSGEVTEKSLTDVFVQGWIDSPPHRENMLAKFSTDTGVAVATTDNITYYAVQLFGRPHSAAFQLTINNESGKTQTIVFRANDQQEKAELQPRMIVKLTRCYPTKVSLSGSDKTIEVETDTQMKVTDQGLIVDEQK